MCNLEDFLKEATEKYSDRTAVTTKQQRISYKQLYLEVGCIRGVLVNVVLPKGKNFGILMGNNVDSVKTFLAITTLGQTAVIIPEDFTKEEMKQIINDYSIGCIIYGMEYADKVKYIRENCEGTIFLTASNLFDEYVPAENVDNPDETAVIMLTKDGVDKVTGFPISHKSLTAFAKTEYFSTDKLLPEAMKSVVLLSVTRPLGLIRSFLSGIYKGGNLYFYDGNEENMFGSLMYFRPDIIILTESIGETLVNWLESNASSIDEEFMYVAIETNDTNSQIKKRFEKCGSIVFTEHFVNDATLLQKLSKGDVFQ